MNRHNWKHEYLDLSETLEKFLHRYPPMGRVTDLLHGYATVVRGLLYAEVNGGLDQCYTEFPDAPVMESCNNRNCYCDTLKQDENGEIESKSDGSIEAPGPAQS